MTHGDDPNGNLCPVCDKSFASAYYVKIHMDSVHEKKARFVCNDCGKTYRRKDGLLTHRENHHNPEGLPKPLKPPKYECKVCGARLRTYVGMKTHMYKHNGIKPYKCRHCQRCFTSMNHWKSHESIHTGAKAHRCPICYKTFTNPGTLYNHLYRYDVHGNLPKVRNYTRGSNVEVLIKAAELCQESSTKKTRSARPKTSQKLEKEVIDSTSGTHSLVSDLAGQDVTVEDMDVDNDAHQISEDVNLDNIQFITHDTFSEQPVMLKTDTSIVIPSQTEAGPSLDDQFTIIQDNGNLESQEVRIVTVDECSMGANTNVTLPYGQQIALIIVPEGTDAFNNETTTSEIVKYIDVNVDHGENVIEYILQEELSESRQDLTQLP